MTSRKPPSQRDQSTVLQRMNRTLQSMAPGTMGGRVANAAPTEVDAFIQRGGVAGDSLPAFTFDTFTVAATPVYAYLLHDFPEPESLLVAVGGDVLRERIDYVTDYPTGEFTILSAQVTLHSGDIITCRYAVATLVEGTSFRLTETVTTEDIVTVTETTLVSLQSPIERDLVESVDTAPVTVVDDTGTTAGFRVLVSADADDGWESTLLGFTATGATIQVGNSGGDSRAAFVRFDIPDLAGKTVSTAWLELMPDASTAAPGAKAVIQADASGTAASPTSQVDMDGRTLTTQTSHWQAPATAGTLLVTSDVSNVINEVIGNGGAITSLLFMLHDDSSATDLDFQIRSYTNLTGPAPALAVRFV